MSDYTLLRELSSLAVVDNMIDVIEKAELETGV